MMLSSVGHRLQTGALLDAVLTKPVKPAALLEVLGSLLNRGQRGPAVYGRAPSAVEPFAVVPTIETAASAAPNRWDSTCRLRPTSLDRLACSDATASRCPCR